MSKHPSALWHRYPWLAYLAVFVGVCGHASSEFVAKLISNHSDIAGPEISVWRFALGGFGLLVVALLIPSSRDLVTPMKRNGLALFGFSVLGVAVAYLFFHWSLDYATVPQVATVVTTAPIFIGIINMIANKVPLTTPKIVTGAAAVLGVAFLVTDGALLALAGEPSNLIGIAFAILCALFMSVYLVLIKPYIEEYGALRITAITLFIGGLVLWLGVGLLFGTWVNFLTLGSLASTAAIAIVVLALYNTTVTQWLWIGGLAAAPDMTRAMYLFFLKPVLAAFLAVVFLGTSLSVWQMLAILVICSAVAVEASWDRLFARVAAAAD
jgi:drug/metabolite transporter (DMT)-like permease